MKGNLRIGDAPRPIPGPGEALIDAVVGEIMDGRLKVPLEETFPLDKAGAMLDRLASRQVAGKLILAVNPS